MSPPLPKSLKIQVARRAHFRCEYCRMAESVSFFSFHVDHIKSLKHGGRSELQNLAYCCPDCNFFKGSDIATFLSDDKHIVRFFNPRKDNWDDHFDLQDGSIYGKTDIGISTAGIFKFNEPERLIFRKQLIFFSLYP